MSNLHKFFEESENIVMIIEGERHTGKTTMLIYLYNSLKDAGNNVYLLGHNYMRTMDLHKMVGDIKEIEAQRGTRDLKLDYILIDEFDYFENFDLLNRIKFCNIEEIKFIITKTKQTRK